MAQGSGCGGEEWSGGEEWNLFFGDMGVCAVGGIGRGCEPLESNMLKITDCGSQERVGGGEGRNVELWRVGLMSVER